jgi:hypothetical protein
MGTIRRFDSGATRDTDEGKLEPWGFTSALVEKVFSEYMDYHRHQSDGELRPSNNWKQGIPIDTYWHSLSRHIMDLRLIYEKYPGEARTNDILDALCGIKFNVDGMIFELKKAELHGMKEKK